MTHVSSRRVAKGNRLNFGCVQKVGRMCPPGFYLGQFKIRKYGRRARAEVGICEATQLL